MFRKKQQREVKLREVPAENLIITEKNEWGDYKVSKLKIKELESTKKAETVKEGVRILFTIKLSLIISNSLI